MAASGDSERLQQLPDADLVKRVKNRDDEALAILLRRHADDLYRFCWHLVSDPNDAEDICQESMAHAIDRIESLTQDSAFRSWLFRIARNLSIDLFRQRRRICRLPQEEVELPELRVEGPQESVLEGEEQQIAGLALSQLRQRYQTVLILREIEGLSYAEIGQRLHASQSAVETLLFRARRSLRKEYGRDTRVLDFQRLSS